MWYFAIIEVTKNVGITLFYLGLARSAYRKMFANQLRHDPHGYWLTGMATPGAKLVEADRGPLTDVRCDGIAFHGRLSERKGKHKMSASFDRWCFLAASGGALASLSLVPWGKREFYPTLCTRSRLTSHPAAIDSQYTTKPAASRIFV